MKGIVPLLADDSGATTVEYALISSALAVMMVSALAAIVAECSTRLDSTSTHLTGLGTTPP